MSGDTFLLLLRLGFSLSIVFGLMWLAGRIMKGRAPISARRNNDQVEVIERKALGRNSSVAVVRIGEQVLALGVTDSNISVLGNVDLREDAAVDVTELPAGPTGAITPTVVSGPGTPTPHPGPTAGTGRTTSQGWLDSLRDKTVRHIPS